MKLAHAYAFLFAMAMGVAAFAQQTLNGKPFDPNACYINGSGPLPKQACKDFAAKMDAASNRAKQERAANGGFLKSEICGQKSAVFQMAALYRETGFTPQRAFDNMKKLDRAGMTKPEIKQIINMVYFNPDFATFNSSPAVSAAMFNVCMNPAPAYKPLVQQESAVRQPAKDVQCLQNATIMVSATLDKKAGKTTGQTLEDIENTVNTSYSRAEVAKMVGLIYYDPAFAPYPQYTSNTKFMFDACMRKD